MCGLNKITINNQDTFWHKDLLQNVNFQPLLLIRRYLCQRNVQLSDASFPNTEVLKIQIVFFLPFEAASMPNCLIHHYQRRENKINKANNGRDKSDENSIKQNKVLLFLLPFLTRLLNKSIIYLDVDPEYDQRLCFSSRSPGCHPR